MNNSLSNWFSSIFFAITDFRFCLWLFVHVDSIYTYLHQAGMDNVANVSEVAGISETRKLMSSFN